MPLIKSGSPSAFKRNVKTLMHDVGKSPHVQSKAQALAVAYATKRRAKRAMGGAVRGYAAGGSPWGYGGNMPLGLGNMPAWNLPFSNFNGGSPNGLMPPPSGDQQPNGMMPTVPGGAPNIFMPPSPGGGAPNGMMPQTGGGPNGLMPPPDQAPQAGFLPPPGQPNGLMSPPEQQPNGFMPPAPGQSPTGMMPPASDQSPSGMMPPAPGQQPTGMMPPAQQLPTGMLGRASKNGGARFASGGSPVPWFVRSEARSMLHSGPVMSAVPGRTDRHNVHVASGSFVLPADHVSSLGQGNTMAGVAALKHMFSPSGPYNSGAVKMPRGAGAPKPPKMMKMASEGGAQGHSTGDSVPIVVAGGEYILTPEEVSHVGGGDINHGHDVLDAWVKHNRKKHVATLKNLPGPAKK